MEIKTLRDCLKGNLKNIKIQANNEEYLDVTIALSAIPDGLLDTPIDDIDWDVLAYRHANGEVAIAIEEMVEMGATVSFINHKVVGEDLRIEVEAEY